MKNYLRVLILLFTFTLYGQDFEEVPIKSNEIKLNVLYLVTSGYLGFDFAEIAYERIITEKSTIGLSFGYSFDNELDNGIKFIAIPYYRYYLGRKTANGIFLEGNGAFYSVRDEDFKDDRGYGVGIGIATGYKFLVGKNGLIGEMTLGGGRNFINTNELSQWYPRFGVSIGKRF